MLHSLNQRLCNYVKWKWSYDCQKAFDKLISLLLDSDVLVHYNPDVSIIPADDVSNYYSVGAVISHVMPSGLEKPIAFSSCILSLSECNYSQLDKKAFFLFLVSKSSQVLIWIEFYNYN